MSLIEEFKKIDAHTFGAYVLIFLAIFSPGFLLLYLYKPHLIADLNPLTLVLFSVSISLPVGVLNTFLIGTTEHNPELEEAILSASLISAFAMYGVLIAAYLWSLSFKGFLAGIAILEVLFLITCLTMKIYNYKKPVTNKAF